MEELTRHFVRDQRGVWECVSPVEINGPNGRMQVAPGTRFARGTTFMGVDIAEWLDELHRKDGGKT